MIFIAEARRRIKKFQAPNPKSQTNFKFQNEMTQTRGVDGLGFLDFGYWNLFGAWCLGFGAYKSFSVSLW
jgi:hypothetical protein